MSQRNRYTRDADPEQFEIKCWIKYESDAAILVEQVHVGDSPIPGDHWIPHSQTHAIHREKPSTGYDRLVITPWIARKCGFM